MDGFIFFFYWMKRLVWFLAIVWVVSLSSCRAYTPTAQDAALISSLSQQITTITHGDLKDIWQYTAQLADLKDQLTSKPQLNYVLWQVEQSLRDRIALQQLPIKQAALPQKQAFVAQYATGIKDIKENDLCATYYKDLDTISFVNNFPTALTMATRYREAGCKRYLPGNGNGPFQILSKNYGSGQLTKGIFYQSVQDFIDFSRAKWTQYKSKLWISLTYTGWDLTGIVNHAALYNGGVITWGVVKPYAPKYVYDGYGYGYSGAIRYGVLPKFLKVLQWEVSN